MMVSTEEVLELKSDAEVPVQEKVMGAFHLQSQGTEQVRLLGWPASSVSGMRMWGVLVRAGEKRGETEHQVGVRCIFRASPGSDPAPPLIPNAPRTESYPRPVVPMTFPSGLFTAHV